MKIYIKLFILLTIFSLIPYVSRGVFAASLKFDNTTATAGNGSTFQISVIVDPGSDSLNSTDVYVTFDSSLLKANSVAAGSLFPTVSNDTSTAGKVYIAGMVNDPASSISSSGTLATITFQGLKEGTGTLSFNCDSSKIIKNDIDATNVIVCSSNGTSAVTIGSGGSNPAPTTPPDSNSNQPVAQLPQSGVFENVANIAFPGIILLLLGSIFRLVL